MRWIAFFTDTPEMLQVRKEREHCRCFIGLSPFVMLASASEIHAMDASPRGGASGFVKALDDHTLLINDQIGLSAPAESQEDMLARYAADL